MLVPLNESQLPSRMGTEDRIPTPGAVTSGFINSDSGVGPLDDQSAISKLSSAAATVIAPAAVAGDQMLPRPTESKVFPADSVTTTPAATAALTARRARSRVGSTSGSPRERLITSMPSETAASTAAAISGELPLTPDELVGTVKAL